MYTASGRVHLSQDTYLLYSLQYWVATGKRPCSSSKSRPQQVAIVDMGYLFLESRVGSCVKTDTSSVRPFITALAPSLLCAFQKCVYGSLSLSLSPAFKSVSLSSRASVFFLTRSSWKKPRWFRNCLGFSASAKEILVHRKSASLPESSLSMTTFIALRKAKVRRVWLRPLARRNLKHRRIGFLNERASMHTTVHNNDRR